MHQSFQWGQLRQSHQWAQYLPYKFQCCPSILSRLWSPWALSVLFDHCMHKSVQSHPSLQWHQ